MDKSVLCLGKCKKEVTEEEWDNSEGYIIKDVDDILIGFIHKKCLKRIKNG